MRELLDLITFAAIISNMSKKVHILWLIESGPQWPQRPVALDV